MRSWILALGALRGARAGAALCALALTACTDAPGTRLHPCVVWSLKRVARCGTITVPENRARTDGRAIALHILVLPASDRLADDPVFVLHGGPGFGGADNPAIAEYAGGANVTRDVVLVDQRGTGGSAPLRCALYGDGSRSQPFLDSLYPLAATRACRDALERRADLAQYTTPIAAEDLDAVRAALGYARVNLLGLSYGTRLALVYMRQHPQRVRSAVLWGVLTTGFPVPLPAAGAGDAALRRVFADCATDAVCGRAFPGLPGDFERLLARLDSAPPLLEVDRGDTIRLTRRALTEGVFFRLYDRGDAATIPRIVHRLAAGDWGAYVGLARMIRRRREARAAGMMLSVLCAEDVPRYAVSEVRALAATSLLGVPLAEDIVAGCSVWPRASLPAAYDAPVHSDVPTLLLSGELDPASPPSWAEIAARTLPRSVHVVRPFAGHVDGDACALSLVTAWIATPDPARLDRGCVASTRRPQWRTD